MTRVLALIAACLAGIGAGECVYRSSSCRAALSRLAGRGELLALVHGVGIYASDLAGHPSEDLEAAIVMANLRYASRHETASASEIERELDLLRFQFGDEKAFENAMTASMVALHSLRQSLAENLRSRAWIEKQIAPDLPITDDECRQYYNARRDAFTQPLRFRASHIFLAAHDATPEEEVEEKRKTIQDLSARIGKGESLAQLATDNSEDNATKARGGDLGFFSAARIPEEFVAQVQPMRVGQITEPFQSHLGFHIVEVTDLKPAREMSFDEARSEITQELANERRAAAVEKLTERLSVAEFRR